MVAIEPVHFRVLCKARQSLARYSVLRCIIAYLFYLCERDAHKMYYPSRLTSYLNGISTVTLNVGGKFCNETKRVGEMGAFSKGVHHD
jgi:hypothetical protein